MPQDFLSNEPFLLIHPVHPPLEGELKFQMQAMTTMIERINFVIGNVCDKLEKRNNGYKFQIFMMLGKKLEVERLAKVYKKTNKEREEWRASAQR
jgi:hypothetical protein